MTTVGWCGAAVRLTGPAEALERLADHLPPFYDQEVTDGAAVVEGTMRVEEHLVCLDLPDGLGLLGPVTSETFRAAASQVELTVVDHQPGHVVLHAGVVALEGRAVVLPGTSMAGKSTLVRALVDAGAQYLSDEYALVGTDGRVSPYPRSMTIRTAGGSERLRPTAARTAEVDAPPLPVALVAQLRWDEGGWTVQPTTSAQAVMTMVANCVNVRRDPERALDALAVLAQGAVSIVGTRGEADEAARRIIDLVSTGR